MASIFVQNLTFAYDGSYVYVFDNVSFSIDTDWKLGFTGRNGRGKTTFMHLLLNKFPYQGRIIAPCLFEYFPFKINNENAYTCDVIDAINPDVMPWQIERELSLLEVDLNVLERPYNTLSSGEKTKLMLAALFTKENHFLLIDEPTNHLDVHGRDVVAHYLNNKSGFILVSHDRHFLDACVDHVLSINRQNIEVVQGNFSQWYENKARQDAFEREENAKLKKEIKRLEKTAKEKASWSDKIEAAKKGKSAMNSKYSGTGKLDRGYIGHQSAKMMARSKHIEGRFNKLADEKSKLLKNIEYTDDLKLTQLDFHSNVLLALENVTVCYDQPLSSATFTVSKGDRIAIAGTNGSGKSSIIKAILGEDAVPYTGVIHKNPQLKISYVSQTTTHLDGMLSDFIDQHDVDESLFKAILRKLDFSREQFDIPLTHFSEGQKKKVLIAKSLCEKAHLLIWDEPLNYIDVISRIQIENLLLTFKPTMIFVEHDVMFCEKITTKTIRL